MALKLFKSQILLKYSAFYNTYSKTTKNPLRKKHAENFCLNTRQHMEEISHVALPGMSVPCKTTGRFILTILV